MAASNFQVCLQGGPSNQVEKRVEGLGDKNSAFFALRMVLYLRKFLLALEEKNKSVMGCLVESLVHVLHQKFNFGPYNPGKNLRFCLQWQSLLSRQNSLSLENSFTWKISPPPRTRKPGKPTE